MYTYTISFSNRSSLSLSCDSLGCSLWYVLVIANHYSPSVASELLSTAINYTIQFPR